MLISRRLLPLCVLIGIIALDSGANAQGPTATMYSIGGVTGATVRDVARVGSVIYAVGTRTNVIGGVTRRDGALWTLNESNPPVFTALPDICNTCGTQNVAAGEAI